MSASRLVFAAVVVFGGAGCSLIAGIRDIELTPADDGGSIEGGDDVAASGDANAPGDGAATDGAFAYKLDPLTIYLGQVAQLTSRLPGGTTNVTFTWSFDVVPLGSSISTGKIPGATSQTFSFTPDLPGTYALATHATHDGIEEAAYAQVHVYEAPIFYLSASTTASSNAFVHAVGTAASDAGTLDCFLTAPQGSNDAWALRAAGAGADTWEGAPGSESRLALMFPDDDAIDAGPDAAPDASTAGFSLIAIHTSGSSCAGTRRRLDVGAQTVPFLQPRFSPDGTRIAYVRAVPNAARVATVGFDGANPHYDVAPFYADVDGGPLADATVPIAQPIPRRPAWKDATHIGWVEQVNNRFQIAVAADQNQQAPSVLMQCGLQTPSEIAFLSNGDVLASIAFPLPDGGTGPTDLVVLTPNGASNQCAIVRNLTHGIPGSSYADFSISPDGKTVAMIGIDPGVSNKAAPYVVPVDGSQAPSRLAGTISPTLGPRWVAGGALLAYGAASSTVRTLPPDAVKVVVADAGAIDAGPDAAPFDAGPSREAVVVQAKGSEHNYTLGNGVYTGCSAANRGAGSLATFAAALAALKALAAIFARRKKR